MLLSEHLLFHLRCVSPAGEDESGLAGVGHGRPGHEPVGVGRPADRVWRVGVGRDLGHVGRVDGNRVGIVAVDVIPERTAIEKRKLM